MWLTRIREEKGARAQTKELLPSTEFLFGGQVKNLSQDLKASSELNPLSLGFPKKRGGQGGSFARGSGAGGSFRGGRGGRGHYGGRGRGAGSGRGAPTDRLSKFKSN